MCYFHFLKFVLTNKNITIVYLLKNYCQKYVIHILGKLFLGGN